MPFKSKKIEQNQQEEIKDDVTAETIEENQQQEIKYITTDTFPDLSKKYLNAITKFLKDKNRRYFGSPGSGLYNQLIDPKYKEMGINKKLVELGAKGEESTSVVLRKWIKDKPSVVLIDSIHLPLGEESDEGGLDEEEGSVNTLGDTDHLLIIGDNLIIIDSKNWKEKAGYSIGEEGQVLRSKNEFGGNRPHIAQSKYLWKKFYDGIDVNVHAYVCIANPNSFIIRDNLWWKQGWKNYKLVNQETLVYFLDKMWNEDNLKDIDYIHVDVVAKAVQGIQQPYNKYKAEFPTFYKLLNK